MPKTIFLLYSGTGSETRGSQSADLPIGGEALCDSSAVFVFNR